MNPSGDIVDLHEWFSSPAGQRVAGWQQRQFDEEVADVFGYHAVQLGLPNIVTLAQNRMPNRWLATQWPFTTPGQLTCDFTALPFEQGSLDLLSLPHTLEWCCEATACLRDVERVLRPEGHLIVTGFNPSGVLGLRQRFSRVKKLLQPSAPLFLPDGGEFIGLSRLRDWLRLLNFEVQTARLGPLDAVGQRLWPTLGAVYFVHAVKRVPGAKRMTARRHTSLFAGAPVQVARKLPTQRSGLDRSGNPVEGAIEIR